MMPSVPIGTLRLILALSLAACSSMGGASASTSPYFIPDRHDVKRYQALAGEQESMLAHCSQPHLCVLPHFSRAFAALYQNRDVGGEHFQQAEAATLTRPLASP